MTAQLHREKQMFQIANEIATAERRDEYLKQACGDDGELYARVQFLLQMSNEAPDFLERKTPPNPTLAVPSKPLETPREIGPYRIRERLAEGGMGVVYVAEQIKPMRRKVALKLIKSVVASPDMVARFETERQALALMDHQNIARVYEGGQTESGQPYYVMELIHGVPITAFCGERKLTTRERLGLVCDVCRAVQHAHLKGIIHRDLKPSNILVAEVDGKAVPKVIDFGVAKAINQPLTDQTLYTQYTQMIGTPLYMSPEQASMGVVDVDTRSDVYSLGVVLYELLTGSTPFDREAFRQATFDEIRRVIREDMPRRPSHSVSTLKAEAISTQADRRGVDERRLRRELQGELDWITLKALEKDRGRRYQSAGEFADDLQNYLDGQAVEACPPSWTYKTRTWARRNRGLVAGTSVALILLLGGIAATSWQLRRALDAEKAANEQATLAKQAAKEAESESRIARAVNEFLNEDLLGSANPTKELGGDVSVRDLLDRAAFSIDERFGNQPKVRAALRETIGRAYLELGDANKAEAALRKSYETRQKHLGLDHRETLSSGCHLAVSISGQGFPDKAESLANELFALSSTRWGKDDELTLRLQATLGSILFNQGKRQVGGQHFQEAHRLAARHLGPKHELSLTIQANLLLTKLQAEPSEENLRKLKELLPIITEVKGPTHPTTLWALQNLATSHYIIGDYTQAQKVYEQLLPIYEQLGGRDYPAYQATERKLAHCLLELGNVAAAIDLAQALMERQEKRYAPGHPALLETANELAQCLLNNQREIEAEQLLVRQLEIARASPFSNREREFDLELTYARVLSQQRKFREAIQTFESILKSLSEDDQGKRALIAVNLGVAHAHIGEWTAAESRFREALQHYQKSLPPNHPRVLHSMTNLITALEAQGKLEQAKAVKTERSRLRGESSLADDNDVAYEKNLRQRLKETTEPTRARLAVLKDLGSLISKKNRRAEAEGAYGEAIEIYEQLELDEPTLEIELGINHWFAVSNQKKREKALDLAQQVYDRAKEILPKGHGWISLAGSNLALSQSALGWELATKEGASQQDGQRATTLLRKSVELKPENANYWSNLGVACNLAGNFQEAVEAFDKSDQLRGEHDWPHRLFYSQAIKGLGKHDDAVQRYCEGWLWFSVNRGGSAEYQRYIRETESCLGLDEAQRDEILRGYVTQTRFDHDWQRKAAETWLKEH